MKNGGKNYRKYTCKCFTDDHKTYISVMLFADNTSVLETDDNYRDSKLWQTVGLLLCDNHSKTHILLFLYLSNLVQYGCVSYYLIVV